MNVKDFMMNLVVDDLIVQYTGLVESEDLDQPGLRTLTYCVEGSTVKIAVSCDGWARPYTKEKVEQKLNKQFGSVAVTGSGDADDPITFEFPLELDEEE